MEPTIWCSLFCTGNEAVGELSVPVGEALIDMPVCDECLEKVMEDPDLALAHITGM